MSHIYTLDPHLNNTANAFALWKHARFIGIGTMLTGGIWTMYSLIKPMVEGISASWQSMQALKLNKANLPRTESDIPLIMCYG